MLIRLLRKRLWNGRLRDQPQADSASPAVSKNRQLFRLLAAESIGTFWIIFSGTGAIIVNELRGGVITHPGICLTFGLVVMALIYALGDISGAHFNPAVTIGFFVARRFPFERVLPYIMAQCLGAVSASLSLRFLFPIHPLLGSTLPTGSEGQSFVLEFLLTGFLMFVVLCVSSGAKEKGITAGIAVGGVILLEALFAGPISGASMNPARSLAPALVSGHAAHLWIYLTAPVLGAIGGVVGYRCVQISDCKATEPVPRIEEEDTKKAL